MKKRLYLYFVPLLVLLAACQGGFPWEVGATTASPSEEGIRQMVDEAVAQLPMPEPGLTEEQIRVILQEELSAVQPVATEQASEAAIAPIPGVDDGTSCVTKLWTYPANDQGILYEFEIQSENPQMDDFYTPGNSTILVLERTIEPNERSDYAMGWGSAWVIYDDRPGCENFDIVGNAVTHAESRLDQGHAGLVVDFRDGETALVVAMLPDLPRAEAERLWDMYTSARHDGEDAVPEDLTYAEEMIFLEWPEGAELPEAVGACPATRGRDFGAGGQVLGPYDHFVVLQPWGNGVPDGQVNYILPTGQTVTFPASVGGGAIWEYPETCGLAQVILDLRGNLPIYHLEDGAWVAGPPSE